MNVQKSYEPDPWSQTRFDLFYSAVGRYWASQVHFLPTKVGISSVIRSWTKPLGQYKGNLALSIYCKSNTDGTAKTNRLRQMVAQCEAIVNCKSFNGFFFELDATNVITPPTVNLTTGYATTILNVAWHTTN